MSSGLCFRGPSLWLLLLWYVGCFAIVQDEEQPLVLNADHGPSWVVGRTMLKPSWVVGVARAPREFAEPNHPLLGERPASAHGLGDGGKEVLSANEPIGSPAEVGVKPMVNKLFTDIATLHHITGEVNPQAATVPTKLVDAALFSASTADERLKKHDDEKMEKDKRKHQDKLTKMKLEAQREHTMKKHAKKNLRAQAIAMRRKNQKKDIHQGVKAAKLQAHEVATAYKASILNRNLAKEAWDKASEKAAQAEAKLNIAVKAQSRAHAEQALSKNKVSQQAAKVSAARKAVLEAQNTVGKDKHSLTQVQSAAEKEENMKSDLQAAEQAVQDAQMNVKHASSLKQDALKKEHALHQKLLKAEQNNVEAADERSEKLAGTNKDQLRLESRKDAAQARAVIKKGTEEARAKASVTELKSLIRVSRERTHKLAIQKKVGGDVQEVEDLEAQIKKQGKVVKSQKNKESEAKEALKDAHRKKENLRSKVEQQGSQEANLSQKNEDYSRDEEREMRKQSGLDKAKFKETEARQGEALANQKRDLSDERVRELTREHKEREKQLAEAAADLEIKRHEANELKKAADRAAYQSKDLMNAADEIDQEDQVRKIGTPEEGQDAINAAKSAASVAARALDAVNKALVANKMQALTAETSNEGTAAAMEAVKEHVTSKLMAAESAKATAQGALSASQAAAKEAAFQAKEAVDQALKAQKEKEQLKEKSDHVMSNAKHAALVAKIALENIKRAERGQPPLKPPEEMVHKTPAMPHHVETPQEVVRAEQKAAHAAKVALFNTVEEVKEFNRRSKAAAQLVAKATSAATMLKKARHEESSVEEAVVRAKQNKVDLFEAVNRLITEKSSANKRMQNLKAAENERVEAKLQLPKLEFQVKSAHKKVAQLKKKLKSATTEHEADRLEDDIQDAERQMDKAVKAAGAAKAKIQTDSKDRILQAQNHILRLDEQIRERREQLDVARERVRDLQAKLRDATSDVNQAKHVKETVKEMEAPLHSDGLDAMALTNAKRADMRYEIDKTAAKVAVQGARDAAHDAKAAIHKEKLDPSSQKLIEAARQAVLEAHAAAKNAHEQMLKVHEAAAKHRKMDEEADKVKQQMMKNAEALGAATKANAKALHAKLATKVAAAKEGAEVRKAEEAMDKAEKAMESAGVNNDSMGIAKAAIAKALEGAKAANIRAQEAAEHREGSQKSAAAEMARAKLLVKKAKIVALSAKQELKRASDAKSESSQADDEESDAEKAVKQAELDLDEAENKAIASASEIETASLNMTVVGNSSAPSNPLAAHEVHRIDDFILETAPEKAGTAVVEQAAAVSALTQKAEFSSIQSALKASNADVRDAAMKAESAEEALHLAQKKTQIKKSMAAQEGILLAAKEKMLRVAQAKVKDAKAAVHVATNEARTKKAHLKAWWDAQSDAVKPNSEFAKHSENVSLGPDKKDLEKTYSEKAVAVDTANQEYIKDAKSDLEVALAKEMVASKEVAAQRVKALTAKNLEKTQMKHATEALHTADAAARNFQIEAAHMINRATKAADSQAPTLHAAQMAASQEAHKLAVDAISKLTDAAANQKQVEATVKRTAQLQHKLTLAKAALIEAREGKEHAEREAATTHSTETEMNVKSWTKSYKERDAKFNHLHTELERATWKTHLTTVQTKHLLSGSPPGKATEDVHALELKNMLSAVAEADANQRKERAALAALDKALSNAKGKLDRAQEGVKDAATGTTKYQDQLQEFIWSRKVSTLTKQVQEQRTRVAAADKERAKYDLDQLSLDDTPVVHQSLDKLRAQTALKMSEKAVQKARKVEHYAAEVKKRREKLAKQELQSALNNWNKIENVIDAAEPQK